MWHDVKAMNTVSGTLFALFMLALFAAGLWWLAQRPMFTLRVIRIEAMGEEPLRRVNSATIKGTAIPRIKGNFFTADLDGVKQAFEAVPWVRKAAVRREWPNKLVVALEEHTPLGTWGEDGRLLSVKGESFTANLAEAEEDGVLPEFAGPDGSERDVVARFKDLHDWFAPIKLQPKSVQLSTRYAWTVKLDNGMTVELGRERSNTTLRERVDRLVGIYPQLLASLQNRIESVDMRYPNGLALKASGLIIGSDSKKK
ncbi:MAG TPA: cell division protein FtsQ/DivIB [Burkholderiaceae bacterium]|jgi:cell division protein FtsQ|nr:cell division protein FtsQ/DivIB [Burkholderiaceae bacterium]